jgi:peptidoglycan hydrolase-like protein with peptidoglycan-binding domain
MSFGFTSKNAFGPCGVAYKEAPAGSPLAQLNMDVHIRNPVGKRGVKNGPDVKIVQQALKAVPATLGGRPDLKDDGIVGPITQGAIDQFQRLHFGSDKADGTVDVKHRTQAKLSSLQPPKLKRMELARARLPSAENCIHAALNTIASNNSPGKVGERARDMMQRHFGIVDDAAGRDHRSLVRRVFRDMELVFARRGAFGNDGFSLHFEAEPFSNKGFFAFTWFNGFRELGQFGGVLDEQRRDQRWFRHDTIYLSAFYDVTTDDDRTQTIVHELAHFVGAPSGSSDRITDNAYGDVDNPNLVALSPTKRMHNAESYGNFAFEAQFGHKPAHKT